MSLTSRITVLVRGIFDKRVRDLEWKKPETVYQNAIEKKRDSFNVMRNSLAGLRAENKRLACQMEEQLRKLEDTETALDVAIAHEDQEKGPLLLQRRNLLLNQIETAKRRRWQLCERIEEGEAKLQDTRHSIEKLESEKNSAVSEIQMLQASRNIDSLWDSFHSAPEDVAVKSLRERLDTEREVDQIGKSKDTDRIVESTIAARDFEALCRNRKPARRISEAAGGVSSIVEAELLERS